MVDLAKINQAIPVISAHIYTLEAQLTSSDLKDVIGRFSPIYQLDRNEVDYLLKILETRYVTTMGAGVSLIDEDIPHDDEWYLKQDIDWAYWKDYEQLLINQGWPTRVVRSMDNVTDKVLGLLKNPIESGDWERRGLVIGHVQSGKTANYIGLVTKAADAGYKFIIVIAGIHNNLRTQTQERIDQGFIGRDSGSATKQHIGVGKIRPNRDMPVTVTTTDSDFNKSVAKRFGLELKSLNNTFILVIKKNVSTLTNLYNWLKELNTRAELEKIADIPMLMIDDEADNASINTNKPELDPTKTNREIRNILNLFKKRCYVGYTATPFANIFIDPDDNDEKLGTNLFPEHFIHCLDAPTNYFGSEKIFLDDEQSDNFIREIDDAEAYIPLRHKKDDGVDNLPPSLKCAIRTFILTRAIRNLREQENEHCSMMINVSRFVNIQREVQQLIDIYIEELQNAVRFNYKLPVNIGLRNHHLSLIHETFLQEFRGCGFDWENVLAELSNAANAVKVFLINSKSDEKLDYSSYTKDDDPLTAIAIGGLSLSRGLTIEGLTVSYIYRNSKMYDTLMQMGRWFGYRDNYEDLCRVYMSEPSYGWYSHIAEATEELRMQIKRMRREGKKPSDFGLYVKAHPDTLIVTALNKMRHAAGMDFHVSYDGKLKETHIIPKDKRKNENNRSLLVDFYNHLIQNQNIHNHDGTLLFTDVSWSLVQEFIFGFKFHEDLSDLAQNIPEYIKAISDLFPRWDVVYQSLSKKAPVDGNIIALQQRNIGLEESGQPKAPSSEPGWYIGKKNRVAGTTIFDIGLSDAQIRQVRHNVENDGRKTPMYRDFANVRNKPIIFIHLLTLTNGDENILDNVPALSISFPNSKEFRTVRYVVGPVWLKQFEQDQYDSTDEEDDYDL